MSNSTRPIDLIGLLTQTVNHLAEALEVAAQRVDDLKAENTRLLAALAPFAAACEASPVRMRDNSPIADQRLAAVAEWRDDRVGAKTAGVSAIHSLLSELLTRVAALERGVW